MVVMAIATVGAVGGATSAHREATHLELLSPFYAPTNSSPVPIESGFRGREDFCASEPLTGHVLYDGTMGHLVSGVLNVGVAGLPPNSIVYVDWSNNLIRGYIIASFKTNSVGQPIPSSMSMGRLAELRGVEIIRNCSGLGTSVTKPSPVRGDQARRGCIAANIGVEKRDVVLIATALTSGDQFSTIVLDRDRQHFDLLADDGA